MAILSRLFETRLAPSRSGLSALLGLGNASSTGINVTVEGSLTYSAVYTSVRIIAEGCASLPLITYERLPNGGKKRAENHYLYDILKTSPNPEMTAFNYRELVKAHLCLWGNHYSEIEYRDGVPVALWPLRPDRMEIVRGDDGELWYRYARTWSDVEREIDWVWLPSWRVHHVRGLGGDGIVGYSPIRMHMEAIGLGLATQKFGATFFGNGARPGVVLKHPGELGDVAYHRLKDNWSNRHQGLENAHRVAILEEGMDFATVGVPPEEAQFLETRKFQVTEIARIFRVPPHMLGDLEHATFSNIEEQDLGFLKHTLRSWLIRYEQSISHALLTPAARKKYFAEHVLDALLRGDTKSRYEAHAIAVVNGWQSRNEVRILENMNPVDGLDEYLVQLNMATVGDVTASDVATNDGERSVRRLPDRRAQEEAEPLSVQEARIARQKLARSLNAIFEDSAARVVRRESNDMRRAVEKYLDKHMSTTEFREWLIEFYREYDLVWADAFRPLFRSYAEQLAALTAGELGADDLGMTDEMSEFIDRYLRSFGHEMAAGGRKQIAALLDKAQSNEDAAELIRKRLDAWEENKAPKVAMRQTFEGGNAMAIKSYEEAGVQYLRWTASGDACPYCQKLNGKVIGINDRFIKKGETIDGGEEGVLTVGRNIRAGHLHAGCDCAVVAA